MTDAVVEPERPTVRHWVYAVAAVFGLQVALILYFSAHDRPAPVRPPFRTAVHLISDAWSSEQLDRLPGMNDPMLFALPGDDGFSGEAWLRGGRLAYEPEHWSEPLRWLAPDPLELGRDFIRFVATNSPAAPLVAEQPAPPLLRYEPHFPSEPLASHSRLRLEGEIAQRPPSRAVILQAWARADVLSNSVVRVAIDAEGRALFPALAGESGLPEADLAALKIAGSTRFRPLPHADRDASGAGPLAWGKVIFEWHTVPPAAAAVP